MFNSYVLSTPKILFGSGLSDHAPMVLCLGSSHKAEGGIKTPSLPVHICKSPFFKIHLDALIHACDVNSLPEHVQLHSLKVCIREAGRRVREQQDYGEDGTLRSSRAALSSISRAIWFNNYGLARRLLRHSPTAKDLIMVQGLTVICTDFESSTLCSILPQSLSFSRYFPIVFGGHFSFFECQCCSTD
jgi:hypothetical protein